VNALRVVVADDNADLARVLGDLIDGEPDLECVARVASADGVLAVSRAAAADILLLDVRLQGGTGIDLLEQLKRELPRLRVLVFTGYAQPELEAEALRRGADGFVAKNGDLDALLEGIRAVRGVSGAVPRP
jgi:DNA-binding NarL/FixJ family response regulator